MQTLLKDLFQDINELIKFAEAKNLGLVAFNLAIITGMITLISNVKDTPWLLYVISYIGVMNLVSLFLCFVSSIAQLKHKESDIELHKSDNLLFFGTIAHYIPDKFYSTIKKRYNLKSENEIYEKELCRQIVICSQIASRKFKLFNVAIMWTFAGIFTPIGILTYKIFFNPNK